jgi:integration host factor subunit alpha
MVSTNEAIKYESIGDRGCDSNRLGATRRHTKIKGASSMSLTKAQIVENIQNQTGLTKIKATETVETLLEIIKSSLADGENVLVSGFGKFCVKGKKQRKGRNPATGDEMMLDERQVVTFKCSGKLREKIN